MNKILFCICMVVCVSGCSNIYDKKLEEFQNFNHDTYVGVDISKCSENEKEYVVHFIKIKQNISLSCMKFRNKKEPV